MKLLMLFGDAAVGKMTVGQELAKLTDLRLFHNHMTIEPVLEIFGGRNDPAIDRMRWVVLEEFAKTDLEGHRADAGGRLRGVRRVGQLRHDLHLHVGAGRAP